MDHFRSVYSATLAIGVMVDVRSFTREHLSARLHSPRFLRDSSFIDEDVG